MFAEYVAETKVVHGLNFFQIYVIYNHQLLLFTHLSVLQVCKKLVDEK